MNSKSPNEILTQTYEFSPEYKEKIHFLLKDIRNIEYCFTCNKIIKKCVYRFRGSYDPTVCCSSECLNKA